MQATAAVPARVGSRAVTSLVRILKSIAPTELAGDWDNVGLLIDSASTGTPGKPYKVFLTNDLTEKVLEEACSHNANFIVTYHPTPFRPMKKFDYRSPTSRIIMECMKREIAVYSPHTALDCVPGGVNDWLISTIAGGIEGAEVSNVAPVNPSATLEGAGEGRIAEVSKGNLAQWIEATKARLGLPGVRVAIAMDAVKGEALSQKTVAEGAETVPIRTVAVCAGSGGSVLRRVKADLIITGELSHHECLAFAHEGCSVILTDHSNTERGYLPVLRSKLIAKYEEGVKASDGAAVEAFPDGIEVAVTQLDADPLVIM